MSIPSFCRCCLRRVERAGWCDRPECLSDARRAAGAVSPTKETLLASRGVRGGKGGSYSPDEFARIKSMAFDAELVEAPGVVCRGRDAEMTIAGVVIDDAAAEASAPAAEKGRPHELGLVMVVRGEAATQGRDAAPGSYYAFLTRLFELVDDDAVWVRRSGGIAELSVELEDPESPGHTGLGRWMRHLLVGRIRAMVPAGVLLSVYFLSPRASAWFGAAVEGKVGLRERHLDVASGSFLDALGARVQIRRLLAAMGDVFGGQGEEPDAEYRERLRRVYFPRV